MGLKQHRGLAGGHMGKARAVICRRKRIDQMARTGKNRKERKGKRETWERNTGVRESKKAHKEQRENVDIASGGPEARN